MMASLFYNTLALLVGAGQAISSIPSSRAGNFTLTLCPPQNRGQWCSESQKPAVLSPTKSEGAPGYSDEWGHFLFQWEAEHLLTWDKEDDAPCNLTVQLGDYTFHKVIRSERSLNFTLKDIPSLMERPEGRNSSISESEIVVSSQKLMSNRISFTASDNATDSSFGNGIKGFTVVPQQFFNVFSYKLSHQEANGRRQENKKWNIGVGVGVGVGVPLLMLLSYVLGKRSDRNQPVSHKPVP